MDLAQLKQRQNTFLISHKTLWNFIFPDVRNLSTQREDKGTCSTAHGECEKTPRAVQKLLSAGTMRSHGGH